MRRTNAALSTLHTLLNATAILGSGVKASSAADAAIYSSIFVGGHVSCLSSRSICTWWQALDSVPKSRILQYTALIWVI